MKGLYLVRVFNPQAVGFRGKDRYAMMFPMSSGCGHSPFSISSRWSIGSACSASTWISWGPWDFYATGQLTQWGDFLSLLQWACSAFPCLFQEWTGNVIDTGNNFSLLIQRLYPIPFYWVWCPFGSQWLPWNWTDSVIALGFGPSSWGSPWY